MIQLTWIAITAIVIGALVRAIKSDGAKIALANLGLPPIPKRALPWVALALGAASALLEKRQSGLTWNEAAMFAVLSAAGAIVGHDLLRGLPGVGKVVGAVLVVAGLSAAVEACTPWQRKAANVVLDVLQCVLANQAKPDAQVVAICASENVKPADVLELLSQQRAALAAARREAAGVCAPDAGPAADAGQ